MEQNIVGAGKTSLLSVTQHQPVVWPNFLDHVYWDKWFTGEGEAFCENFYPAYHLLSGLVAHTSYPGQVWPYYVKICHIVFPLFGREDFAVIQNLSRKLEE